MSTPNSEKPPEIGSSLQWGECQINYHDHGSGTPILLVHGSGPGVTAWANWRGVIPTLSQRSRVIAPDMLGFGYTHTPLGMKLNLGAWVGQLVALLDALKIEKISVVGNSFGGAVALALAVRHPQRVERLALMGAVGLSFPITDALEKVWGYQPSLDAMKELLKLFVFNHSILSDDLARMRYEASIRDDVQTRFSQLFPQPRQNGVELLAQTENTLRQLQMPTLVIHGRDDLVIPVEVSERMARLIPRADLHIFCECGHWVQIERTSDFVELVSDFMLGPGK
jgi:2-hydroxymuconate-semialdehyde hydrolase